MPRGSHLNYYVGREEAMTSTISDILVFDSDKRSSGGVQDALYNLVTAGLQPEGTWEALDFSSANEVYNVELGVNDVVYWDDDTGGGPFSAVVSPGSYDRTTLDAALVALMDAAAVPNYTFTENATTGILTVSSTALFNWEFGTNTTRSIRKLLGVNEADTGQSGSIPGDFIPDLFLHTHLILRLSSDGNEHVRLMDASEFSFIIPLSAEFGDRIAARKLINYQQTVFYANPASTVTITLFTEDGVALVNNPRYVLTLRKLF